MIELSGAMNAKGGRLVGMKRTYSYIVCASSFQLYVLAYQRHDIGSIADFGDNPF